MKRRYVVVALLIAGLLVGGALLVMKGGAPDGERADDSGDKMSQQNVRPPRLERPRTDGPSVPPPAGDLARIELVPAEVHADPDLASGAFEGVVVNWGSSKPVPGAELTFAHEGATVTAQSDESGRFRLVPPKPGRYTLAVATAEGFLPYAPELGRSPIELVARARMRVSGILVYLSPAIDYTGVVLDAAGKPVAGAEITRVGAGSTDALIPIETRFVSGSDGTFSFHAFDNTVFEAHHPEAGYGRGALGPAAQVSRRMEIRLSSERPRPTGSIAGVVVDDNGAPIVGAVVRATVPRDRSMGPDGQPSPVYEVESGDDGRFAIAGLEPTPHVVVAEAEGHARQRARATPGGPAVRLVLPAGAVIRGRVVDADGGAVASFTVIASRVEGPLWRGPGRSISVFDGDGAFEITGLEAREYAVVATAAGHAPSAEVTAGAKRAADAEPVTVSLTRGGVLTGVVIDAESRAPLENARISVEGRVGIGASATPAVSSAVTAADGTFRLPGLSPGKRSVNAAAFAHHQKIVTGIEVAPGAEIGPVEIALPPVRDGEVPKTEFAGIGCAISGAGDGLRINQVFPGSGCKEAGLQIDDVIIAVEGVAVVDLGFQTALERLRGPAGTQVTVSLRRADDPARDVIITRRKITL